MILVVVVSLRKLGVKENHGFFDKWMDEFDYKHTDNKFHKRKSFSFFDRLLLGFYPQEQNTTIHIKDAKITGKLKDEYVAIAFAVALQVFGEAISKSFEQKKRSLLFGRVKSSATVTADDKTIKAWGAVYAEEEVEFGISNTSLVKTEITVEYEIKNNCVILKRLNEFYLEVTEWFNSYSKFDKFADRYYEELSFDSRIGIKPNAEEIAPILNAIMTIAKAASEVSEDGFKVRYSRAQLTVKNSEGEVVIKDFEPEKLNEVAVEKIKEIVKAELG